MWTDNPLADFLAHDAEQEEALSRWPICECCGEPIQEDYYFTTDEGNICEECFERKFVDPYRDEHMQWIDY